MCVCVTVTHVCVCECVVAGCVCFVDMMYSNGDPNSPDNF